MIKIDHLFDTCTIKHKICNKTMLLATIKCCSSHCDTFAMSEIILRELVPPSEKPEDCDEEQYQAAKDINTFVKLYAKTKQIKVINTMSSDNVLRNLNDIRERYYGWMTRPKSLKRLIQNGELSECEVRSKSFRYKDMGECSLIAIALESPHLYIIVSDDQGKVYKHPYINIFDIYKDKGLTICKFKDWLYYNETI